ncbi:MAG: GAF domain-containing protein, partial [Clostridia bacterium]|nr:GAF domain-containing protein [Clostridia bacterium]
MSTLQSALLAKYGELLAEFEHRVVWVSDVKTNEMLYMNRMAKVLIGIEEDDEYLGKPCYQVLHGNNRPCTFCPNCKNVSDNHYCWTQYNVRAHKWLIIDDHLITVDDHTCRMEITKELLPNEMGQINSENILLQSIQTLTANKDFHSAIDTFLEMVGGFYFADRTYVFELDFENGVTNNIFEWCDIGVEPQIDLLQNVPINEVDEWIASFLQNKEYVIRSLEDDLDHDSDTYKRLAPQQITALLVAPIFIEEKLFGFIGVDNPELQLDNINLLRAATDVIAVEIDKQRMLERLEYLSYTDILTGTYNRNRYIRELHERYHNPPQTLGVIIADINGLKGL